MDKFTGQGPPAAVVPLIMMMMTITNVKDLTHGCLLEKINRYWNTSKNLIEHNILYSLSGDVTIHAMTGKRFFAVLFLQH